jgi:hypothetical protein
MNHSLRPLLVTALLVAVGLGFAATGPGAAAADFVTVAPAASMRTYRVRGTITAVDAGTRSITMRNWLKTYRVAVPRNCLIRVQHHALASFDNLQPKDSVEVLCRKVDGQLVAVNIAPSGTIDTTKQQ